MTDILKGPIDRISDLPEDAWAIIRQGCKLVITNLGVIEKKSLEQSELHLSTTRLEYLRALAGELVRVFDDQTDFITEQRFGEQLQQAGDLLNRMDLLEAQKQAQRRAADRVMSLARMALRESLPRLILPAGKPLNRDTIIDTVAAHWDPIVFEDGHGSSWHNVVRFQNGAHVYFSYVRGGPWPAFWFNIEPDDFVPIEGAAAFKGDALWHELELFYGQREEVVLANTFDPEHAVTTHAVVLGQESQVISLEELPDGIRDETGPAAARTHDNQMVGAGAACPECGVEAGQFHRQDCSLYTDEGFVGRTEAELSAPKSRRKKGVEN